MEIEAPQDRKTGSARVNWLLKQLKQTEKLNVFVRIKWPSRAQDTVCRLSDLREDPKGILSEATSPPKSFEVFSVSEDGRRFAGRRTFIEEVERAVPVFYDQVGQHLKRWMPSPPKPVAKDLPQSAAAPKEKMADHHASKGIETPVQQANFRPGNKHHSLLDLPDFLRRVEEK